MVSLFATTKLVGVDVGTSSVKLVELEETKSGYRLKNFGIAKLPRETIVNGVVINAEPLIKAVKGLINSLKINTRDVVFSVSCHPVIIKKIALPFMTEESLEPVIVSEAEQYIPFDLDEVNIDFQILGNNDENPEMMDVMLVAAKKAMIDEYTDAFKHAGLRSRIVDIDVFALENMFNVNYLHEENETFALVDIGASVTNINILRNGVSIFNRDVFLGGNQITEEIQKELSVSFEEAEMLKVGEDIEGINRQVLDDTIARTASSIAKEIQRTLEFFTSSTYVEINHLFVSGGASKTAGLKEMIEDKMNLAIELTDPFKTIKYDTKAFDTEYMRDMSAVAAVGVGLATRRLGD